MGSTIRPLREGDLPAVVALSLRAWEPVFGSLRTVLGNEIFLRLHPDWRADQEQAVRSTCAQVGMSVRVADLGGGVAGFVTFGPSAAGRRLGTIEMLAVDPSCQRQGIGTALTRSALDGLRDAGLRVGMVETGGDPGHAAARRTYEKAGLTLLLVARYLTALDSDP